MNIKSNLILFYFQIPDVLENEANMMNYSKFIQYPCDVTRSPLTHDVTVLQSELLNVVMWCSTNVTLEVVSSVSLDISALDGQ